MRIIKKILLFLLFIIVVLLIVALFVKKEFSVEREIVINRSKEDVFNYVKLLKNQDNYSKWATMDPKMKKEYKGTDGTVGFISAWDSDIKDVGKGEQEITNITDGERIDYALRFIKPFENKATTYMITEKISENQTRVKWGFSGKMKYPMNIMLLFMNMEKMVGNDFQTGLSNLKNILEK